MPADPIRLTLPLNPEEAKELHAGQACLLSGPLFTLRDAGHQRLLAEMGDGEELPYGLTGQTIFYAGPTPSAAGRPFGAIGPTTASRMDFAAPRLMAVSYTHLHIEYVDELPEDFICPICGVGRDLFERIEL